MGYEIKNLYRASYLEMPRNKSRAKMARQMAEIFSAIKVILVLRIGLTLFDILPRAIENSFESISYPLVAPLYLFLGTTPPTSGVEWVAVFAFAMYAIAGWLVVESMRSNIISAPAEEYDDRI